MATNDRLVKQALRNGAEIIGDTPARRQTNTQPKTAAPDQYLNRLAKAAALGWRGISTTDALWYVWTAPDGRETPPMSYEEATAYAAHTPPEGMV